MIQLLKKTLVDIYFSSHFSALPKYTTKMVGYPSYGLESQNYFSTKQNKVSKAAAGGENHRGSPKFQKNQQLQQSRPLGQHNGQNLNTKPKSIPSGQKQSSKHPLERQNSSPRPIPNKHPRNNNSNRSSPSSSNRSSPSSTRSSPPRSTVSPSRSSPNNFASSIAYLPPTPSSLPKPPVHWTSCQMNLKAANQDPSAHLKILLNVQA